MKWCVCHPEKPAQSGSPQGSPPEQEEEANGTSHLKEVWVKSSVGRNLLVIQSKSLKAPLLDQFDYIKKVFFEDSWTAVDQGL